MKRSSTPGLTRHLIATLVVTVAALASACGGTGPDEAPVSVEAITQSTTSAGSARMSMTVTMSLPQAGEVRTVMDGVTTLDSDVEQVQAEMTLSVKPAPAGGTMQGTLRLVDGRMFVQGAVAQSLGVSDVAGAWVEVIGEQRDAFAQLGATGTNPTDPTTALTSLQTVEGLEAAGRDTMRGVDTQRLSATTSLGALLDAQDADLRQRLQAQQQLTGEASDEMLDRLVSTMRDLPAELDVWIDDQQRLRRSRLQVDTGPMWQQLLPGGAGQDLGEVPMVVDIEQFDYGTPVDVTVPESLAASGPATPSASPAATPLETPNAGMASAQASGGLTIDGGPLAGRHEAQGSCTTTGAGQGVELDLYLAFVHEPQRSTALMVRVPFAEGTQQTRQLMLTIPDSDGYAQQATGTASATVDLGPVTQRSAREYVTVALDGTVNGHDISGEIRCQPES